MDADLTARPAGRLTRLWQRLVLPTAAPGAVTVPGGAPGPVRATIAVAAVPSAASLVWTAWSLMDMIPAPWPVGLAAGVVLDIALVSAVAIGWIAPHVAKPAKLTGWLIAALAGVLVGYHAWLILPVLAGLGLIPLVAKGLWHLALNAHLARTEAEAVADAARAAHERKEAEARRVAEEEAERRRVAEAEAEAARAAELSTDLTHDQQAEIAAKRRAAAHAREAADAEAELADAQAEREHRLKLAAIRREAAQTREMDREDAEVIKQRVTLAREIQAGKGLPITSGETPDDLSTLAVPPGAGPMGFGGVMGSDLRVSRGRPSPAPDSLDPRLQELVTYIADAGDDASVRGAAKELGVAAATIRRWRTKAETQGLDMSPLHSKEP